MEIYLILRMFVCMYGNYEMEIETMAISPLFTVKVEKTGAAQIDLLPTRIKVPSTTLATLRHWVATYCIA